MQKLLTILVPTYNMQAYLNRCLDSLIVAPELMERLEVIVVNDGSKDNSSAIAHEYEAKYPETFRVIDKENGNYGSCINRGLAEANGQYIKVLDADDWFDAKEFSSYLRDILTIEVDLILTPYKMVDEKGFVGGFYISDLPEKKIHDFNSCPLGEIVYYTMHMVTYRTALLREIDYWQTEGISYTDNEWTHIPQFDIKQFVYLPYPVYQYLQGREGQTMTSESLAKNVWNFECVCKSLIDNMKKHSGNVKGLAYASNLQEVIHSASFVYRINLIRIKPSVDALRRLKEFDQYFKDACPEAYAATSNLKIKSSFPVKYVSYWRRTGKRFPVEWLRVFAKWATK